MNSQYLNEYASNLERILSIGYEYKYSTPSLERLISYSEYFQNIEKDNRGFAPITNDVTLIKDLFPNLKVDLLNMPHYNQCLWAAESYLRIQGETGLTFECIFLYIPINKMYEYFPLYHEMDFSHIINEFKRLYVEKSALQLLIERYHYSLSNLSKEIGVSYDMLYSLKLRRRDIKKTSVEIVARLSQVFNVRIETIAETIL